MAMNLAPYWLSPAAMEDGMQEDGDIDEVDFLPEDPFGMENFTAAIVGWMEDLEGDTFFTDLEYLLDRPAFRCPEPDGESSPHDGLLLSLGHLGVRDLLSMERVCRPLRAAVRDDPLLWRCIHIESPLSEKITDNKLVRLADRARGSLECLSLIECSRISDDALKHVLQSNLKLTKLSIPGCLRLSVDGLINNLKICASLGGVGLKCLRLGRLFSITEEQFGALKWLLKAEHFQRRSDKPQFYHYNRSAQPIDIELCPICEKVKLVYDCPMVNCQGDEGFDQCRACEVCIPRCLQCGRCIINCAYMETFSLSYVCSTCWESVMIANELIPLVSHRL
ncbi:F-box protein SKIP14-like [Dioscorea cayenensis subsp. rotundata]|uniref:F-box protein SKIP14-like n=1 Tax=Dioscorea cayennensis subsp. rotundata TaxID=55577 RepID=A0AB40CGK4_DIOCR|nr:F-box protein SKIP14-like [Dioscorea cayenensis subsp. rotundata]